MRPEVSTTSIYGHLISLCRLSKKKIEEIFRGAKERGKIAVLWAGWRSSLHHNLEVARMSYGIVDGFSMLCSGEWNSFPGWFEGWARPLSKQVWGKATGLEFPYAKEAIHEWGKFCQILDKSFVESKQDRNGWPDHRIIIQSKVESIYGDLFLLAANGQFGDTGRRMFLPPSLSISRSSGLTKLSYFSYYSKFLCFVFLIRPRKIRRKNGFICETK